MRLTDSIHNDEQETVFAGTSIHPAVIAVWAAIIATGNMLPTIPMLGVSGAFTISVAFVPLAGILFGPVAGAVCAAVGAFIAQLIAPHTAWLGLATFLVATINAAAVGLITRGRWYLTAGIIGIGYGLWFATPIGREATLFPLVFYTLGLVATVIGAFVWRRLAAGRSGNVAPVALLAVGIFVASYAGFVSAAGLANFAAIALYQTPATVWVGLTVVAPIERAVFSLAATVIGVPLVLGLPKIGVRLGLAAIRPPSGDHARARKESDANRSPHDD